MTRGNRKATTSGGKRGRSENSKVVITRGEMLKRGHSQLSKPRETGDRTNKSQGGLKIMMSPKAGTKGKKISEGVRKKKKKKKKLGMTCRRYLRLEKKKRDDDEIIPLKRLSGVSNIEDSSAPCPGGGHGESRLTEMSRGRWKGGGGK